MYTEGTPIADTKAPSGPIENRWEQRRLGARLVNPANKRKLSVIVVGTCLLYTSTTATACGGCSRTR